MNLTLHIEETISTPCVDMDKEKGIFKISGRSLPEDPGHFYAPVKEYLRAYIANPNPDTEFIFKMDYHNSASTKQFITMLFALEQILQKGKKIKVIWYYNKEDEVVHDKGEEIKSMTSIPFELKAY